MSGELEQIEALLRIKRAREQRAAASAARARAAEHRAETARRAAAQAVADDATRRPLLEAEIYARLTGNKVPSTKLQAAAARLTGMTAYAAVLRQQSVRADTEHAASVTAAVTADRTRALQSREVAAADMLRERHMGDAVEGDEEEEGLVGKNVLF